MHSIHTRINLVRRFESLDPVEQAQHILSNSYEYIIYLRSLDYLNREWPHFRNNHSAQALIQAERPVHK